MPLAMLLLPLALAAFAFCAIKALKKFPAGAGTLAWVIGLSALSLLAIILLLLLRQE